MNLALEKGERVTTGGEGRDEIGGEDVNIQEDDMGRGDGSSKSDRAVSIEAFKEKEKGIMTMNPQQEDIIK